MEILTAIPEHNVLLFLAQFGVILLTARVFGELMQRLGQPSVLGELLAGILLGPSFLGLHWPGAYAALFPAEPLAFHLLEILASLGMIFLLFIVGMETDVRVLRELGRPAVTVALCDLLATFSLGLALGYYLPEEFLGALGNREVFILFMGVAISVTAIPVLAKILMELDLIKRNLGITVLGAGLAEDLFGWIALSIVMDLANRGSVSALSVGRSLLSTGLFLALAWSAGRRVVRYLMKWADENSRLSHRRVTLAVLIVLAGAAATQWIGIHAVFGAFLAGILVAHSPAFRPKDRETLEGLSFGIFSPIFFSFAGLQVRLHEMQEWGFFAVVLAAATFGKLLGAYLGGRLGGFGRIESAAMGIGMNARGAMELVLALLGLSAGIISPSMFSIVVMTAVITSLMTPPLLRLVAPHIPLGEDEQERMRQQAREARALFKKKDMKILVPTAGGPNAAGILTFVAPLVQPGRAALTLLMVREPGKSFKEKVLQFLRKDPQTLDLRETAEALKGLAKERGLSVAPKIVTSEARQDAVLEEALQGYDLLLLGAHSRTAPYAGDFLEQVVANSPVHTAIFRGAGQPPPGPFRRILLPTKGDGLFPFVFEFAALFAENTPEASLTVLHVIAKAGAKRRRWRPLSLLLGEETLPPTAAVKVDPKAYMSKLVAEALEGHASDQEQAFRVEQKSVEGEDTVQAILKEAKSGGYDLVILGAVKHLVRERLFFGHKIDELTQQAPCPVVVVTPKRQGVESAAAHAA